MTIQTFPTTSGKAILALGQNVVFFLVSLICMAFNIDVNEPIFYTLAGYVLGADAIAAAQFYAKRKTAWKEEPKTASEAETPKRDGQPAKPAMSDLGTGDIFVDETGG